MGALPQKLRMLAKCRAGFGQEAPNGATSANSGRACRRGLFFAPALTGFVQSARYRLCLLQFPTSRCGSPVVADWTPCHASPRGIGCFPCSTVFPSRSTRSLSFLTALNHFICSRGLSSTCQTVVRFVTRGRHASASFVARPKVDTLQACLQLVRSQKCPLGEKRRVRLSRFLRRQPRPLYACVA